MYAVGSLILYGRTGVCRVEDVTELPAAGEKGEVRAFYLLRPLYQNGTIMAPVKSVDDGTLPSRPIMSRAEAGAFVKELPALEAEPCRSHSQNLLREHYRRQLEDPTSRGLALLIRSIYRKNQEARAANRRPGAVDQRFLEEAEDLLYGELAAALGMTRDEVQDHMDAALGAKTAGAPQS